MVFTMLNLDLNSWLIRTKNLKIPADEASLYSLCQLYSCHALAYTTGSIWSTLELHGNYSINELKQHCDIHLVFLEGGILAQLHKKPTIPRLLSVSSATDRLMARTSESSGSSVVQMTSTPLSPKQGTDSTQDHTYTSPISQMRSDVLNEPPVIDQKREQHPPSDDHSYAELSDVPTEPYEHDSDSQDDIVTTGGKVIISSSDKVEISVEYQCENTLPEATKGSTTTEMTGSEQCESSKSSLNGAGNVLDNNVNNSANELPDDTTPNKDVLLDETTNKSVISDITDTNKTTSDVLPDDTVSENKVLSDKTENNDTVNTGEQQLTISNTTSTDDYPDTTATASTLREATDITSKDISADTPSSKDVGTKIRNNITNITINENIKEVSLDTTTAMLPDETTRPSTPLPEANLHKNLQTPENIASTTHESKESEHVDLDTNEPVKQNGRKN